MYLFMLYSTSCRIPGKKFGMLEIKNSFHDWTQTELLSNVYVKLPGSRDVFTFCMLRLYHINIKS